MIIRIGLLTIIIIAIPFIIYTVHDIKRNKQQNKIKYLFLFIFFIYFINLLKYAIFPIYLGGTFKETIRNEMTLTQIIKLNTNLIPLISGFNKKDFLLNIVMTFPLGFLLPCLKKNLNTRKIIIIGLLTGLLIELTQFLLIFIQGFTFRNININDSIANFIGVYLGYKTFFLSFKILFNELNQKKLAKYKILKSSSDFLYNLNEKAFKNF